jgi:hypothetical protein
MLEALVAKKGINNYLNPSARDASITSPTAGTICVIRQNSSGSVINTLQIYDGSSWVSIARQSLVEELELRTIMGVYTL